MTLSVAKYSKVLDPHSGFTPTTTPFGALYFSRCCLKIKNCRYLLKTQIKVLNIAQIFQYSLIFQSMIKRAYKNQRI
jgi:hypothetical protein